MLSELEARLSEASEVPTPESSLDVDALAQEFSVDLTSGTAAQHVEGESGLRQELAKFETKRSEIVAKANTDLASAASPVKAAVARWRTEHANLEERLKARQAELESQGLKVQAGAVREIATRLDEVKTTLTALRKRQTEHDEARKKRKRLVDELHHNRETLFLERGAVLKRIAQEANAYADDLTIRVSFDHAGTRDAWVNWLTKNLDFRKPRVLRVATAVAPPEFARQVISARGREKLLALEDADNTPLFTRDQLERSWKWSQIFELETMLLPDRPRIEVQRRGSKDPQPFITCRQASSVRYCSVFFYAPNVTSLSCSISRGSLRWPVHRDFRGSAPRSSERERQVLIATHSANLTVLGDAELVIPMVVKDGKGRSNEPGAVDRPETRDRVCALPEGGVEAYKKRGRRYGLRFVGESS
ncbi:MAG TPA: hypothetical protein VF529_14300 [Solirubrobacteraceae bacterium]|jgi:hypothetical protein